MMKRVILLFFAIASSVRAGCSGASPTWTATADQSSVQTCINNAVNGDTVNVLAGSAPWTTVGWSGKNINLIGAGSSSVTIALNGNLNIDTSIFRLSGFTINAAAGIYINISNSTGWRIDHNILARTNWDIIILAFGNAANPIEGVIDHNTDTFGRIDIQGEDTSRGGRDIWANPLNPGTVHAIYVETNTINFPDGTTGGSFGNYVDGNQGCRIVARFNTILGSRRESHGLQGENQDGCQLFEDYNNTMTQPANPNARPYLIRGGSGFIFHNTSDGLFSLNNGINIDSDRAEEDSIASQVPNWQFCDGKAQSTNTGGFTFTGPKTLNIDSGPNNGTTSGYPCRDQLGRGSTGSVWNYTTTPPSQTLAPAYFWKNTNTGGTNPGPGEMPLLINCETPGDALCNNMTNNILVQNRDYYGLNTSSCSGTQTTGVCEGTLANRAANCTAGVGYWATDQGNWNQSGNGAGQGQFYQCTGNAWILYYTPLTYPHPLVGGTPQSATPTFSPVAGNYLSPQVVTVTSTTGGAIICLTKDSSAPTANGSGVCTHGLTLVNGGTVFVSTTTLLRAVASEPGFLDSSVGGAQYNLPPSPATAMFAEMRF